MQHAKRLLVS